MAVLSLRCEQDAERLAIAVRTHLVDLAPEMACRCESCFPHVLHRRDDRGSVDV
jgi:hypothetical protein